MKKYLIIIFLALSIVKIHSQDKSLFRTVYPIGDKQTLGYKTNMKSSNETIIFEASPILRMPFFNNIRERFMDKKDKKGSTLYIGFNPTLRMYVDRSRPVRTPSYKIGLGYQALHRINNKNSEKGHFFSYMFESGHYSNGQNNSAFSNLIVDGTPESQQVYQSINAGTNLSNILNRESGNFSTNFTEIALSYRIVEFDDNIIPISGTKFNLSWYRFHNNLLHLFDIGGYTKEDINIYGKNRFKFGVEQFRSLSEKGFLRKKLHFDRVSFSLDYEYIYKPHPFVNPSRFELTAISYFVNNVGLFISGIYGHDNYNYRFVDSGFQIFLGFTFDIFPPFEMGN
jgi:hypothetical protein